MKQARLLLLATLVASLSVFTSCDKTEEEVAENLIVSAMTSGKWKVTKYLQGSVDKTAAFGEYLFQFQKDRTVDAERGNVVEKTGNWEGNATDRTIYSNFVNVGEPLVLLNGTWNITNNSWNFVEASQVVNGQTCVLRLDKQP